MMKRTARLGLAGCLSLLATRAVAAEGGLPQLDHTWYASQVFWLAVHFVALLLIARYLILPTIARALDQREQRIAADLGQAEEMQKDAQKARLAYDAALAGARTKAQELRASSAVQAATERVQAEQKLAEDLAVRAAAAGDRIAKASAAMRSKVRDVAAEAGQDIVSKIAGLSVDRATFDAALGRILDQRLKEVA